MARYSRVRVPTVVRLLPDVGAQKGPINFVALVEPRLLKFFDISLILATRDGEGTVPTRAGQSSYY
jgi:hypothetical protein